MNNWIEIKDRLPEAEKRVLGFYTNACNMPRIDIVQYIPAKTVLASDFLSEDAEGCSEYDEEIDEYYVVEGWWESSWESETNWKITEEITHWMALPEIPNLK